MRIELYNTIKSLLSNIKNDNNKPIIKHIDLWNFQTSDPVEEQAFYLPAVFIEIGDIQYNQELKGRQDAVINFTLHVVTNARKGTLIQAMTANTTLCNIIHKNLWCKKGTNIGAISRIQSITDSTFTEIIENEEVYQCRIVDDSALWTYDIKKINSIEIIVDNEDESQAESQD